MFVVTSNQMYKAECNAVKRGISFPQLMENAGQACAKIIKNKFSISKSNPKKVLIICGKGKNGADGFVIARAMWEYGSDVTVMLACGDPRAKDAIDMYSLVETAGIDIIRYDNNLTILKPYIDNAEIIVTCDDRDVAIAYAEDGTYSVIDWAHVTQGNASADAART